MRWFYLIAAGIVALLTASPFLLLKPPADDRFAGRLVAYNIYGAKVKSMDPATCGDTTSAGIQGNFYEGLYCYHYLKRPLEVIPQLAEAMPEISPDGLTYTIRIKKAVKYARNPCFGVGADGRPATRTVQAKDFVLAFKRIADFHVTTALSMAFIHDKVLGLKEYRDRTQLYNKGDFSRYDKEELRGVQALDEHTLQFTLTEPFPQFTYVLAMHVYAPIPREVIDYHLASKPGSDGERVPIPMRERDPEIRDSEAAVGTGPYILTEWIRGGRIVLQRNPDFREEFYPSEGDDEDQAAGLLRDAGKRVPFVDVRYLTFVEENNPAWMMFRKKQRDSAGIPRDVYGKVISPSKELLAEYQKEGIRLIKETYPAIYWFAFNMEDRVLGASKSLRQALCLCYNVEDHVEVLFNGRGKRAVNTLPSTFKGHKEAGPSPYARLDLAAARAKLQQAKKELIEAGVIEAGQDIPTLTLDMPGRDEEASRMGEFAQGQFKRLGVELKVELNDWPTLQKKVHMKQCQMYAMGWHADYPDGENFLQLYYSANIKRGTNNTNYSNRQFDELFEQAAVTMDEGQRVALYAKMVRILNEDCPALLLSEPISYILIYNWVHNVKPHPIGYGFAKYTRLDAELRRRMGGR